VPWHLSKSNPRKIYDERHEPVCVCATAEQAARIVAAVTGKSQEVIRLKEPLATIDFGGGRTVDVTDNRSRVGDFADGGPIPARKPYIVGEHVCEQTITLTDSFEPDQGCCSAAIMSASRKGALGSLTSWECPRCGCEWTPKSAGMFRHWSPASGISVFKSAR
jgi:hypothetical protein